MRLLLRCAYSSLTVTFLDRTYILFPSVSHLLEVRSPLLLLLGTLCHQERFAPGFGFLLNGVLYSDKFRLGAEKPLGHSAKWSMAIHQSRLSYGSKGLTVWLRLVAGGNRGPLHPQSWCSSCRAGERWQ